MPLAIFMELVLNEDGQKKKTQLKSMLHLKANLINLWVQWTKIVLKTFGSGLLSSFE